MTTDNRTNEGASAKAECAPHHWVSHHQDGLPVRWIEQCSLCGSFNTESLREQIHRSGGQFTDAMVEAAAKVIRRASLETTADPGDFWSDCYEEERERWRNAARAALVAAQGAAPAVSGNTSDGFHTFDELYEYRMLYNAHAAHGWLAAGIPVVKSWRHSDGEECFGGGWFIVTATLPSGQVSNHYKAEHWGLFKVPEVELPPEYDGHTPHDAAMRLRIEAEHAATALPSSGVDEVWRGRIVTASFEDGKGYFDCGLEDCECPEHEQPPRPVGTYVTVRLDKGRTCRSD